MIPNYKLLHDAISEHLDGYIDMSNDMSSLYTQSETNQEAMKWLALFDKSHNVARAIKDLLQTLEKHEETLQMGFMSQFN